GTNYARLRNRRDFSWTLDNMIMYNKTIAEKHNLGVTLLQTASSWNTEESAMSANNIPKESYLWHAFGSIDITNSGSTATMSAGLVERQLSSYVARANYGVDDRCLISLSGRWDGASQLGEGNKWDFVPSAAFAWRIKQETFMSEATWITDLK